MFADSHQAGTLEIPRGARSVRFGGIAIWLIAGLAVASLLVGLIWNHYQVRYPGADYQSTNQFHVTFQYQTPDDLPKVLRWYSQHYALSHEVPQGDNCVMVTGEDDYLFLQGSLAVTLCAHQTHTLIFVDRSFAVH
ncbi:MAG TPA: hypothetical protein VJM08_05360 [Anaerolineales bacterium]|nr:hypothetical protein [Anaerolineales bacterium]